jgi:hypothetical protein
MVEREEPSLPGSVQDPDSGICKQKTTLALYSPKVEVIYPIAINNWKTTVSFCCSNEDGWISVNFQERSLW